MSFKIEILNFADNKYGDDISRFLSGGFGSTIFHHPKFLSYHGNRFANEEAYLAWYKGEEIFAVMPAALISNHGRKTLFSPYGASFGGIVLRKSLKLQEAIAVVEELINFCESESLAEVELTFPPQIYFQNSNDALFFALERSGFTLRKRDIFSVLDLSAGYDCVWDCYEGRARTAVRKSEPKFEIHSFVSLEDFYPILLEDKKRLNSKPTHTLDELLRIEKNFPALVWADIAIHKDTGAKAGVCYFAVTDDVVMTFYMSQETDALKLNGINVLVNFGIKETIKKGFHLFDFGGSTVGYEIQNIGVANFKQSFGASSSSRITYKWKRDDH